MTNSRYAPGQTTVKIYRNTQAYAKDATKMAKDGWIVVSVVSHEDMTEHLFASFLSRRAKMSSLVVTYQIPLPQTMMQPGILPPQPPLAQDISSAPAHAPLAQFSPTQTVGDDDPYPPDQMPPDMSDREWADTARTYGGASGLAWKLRESTRRMAWVQAMPEYKLLSVRQRRRILFTFKPNQVSKTVAKIRKWTQGQV